jgi:type II secretory pathway pseudopilin PulG
MTRQRGYVLVEMVVGAAITCAIAGVLFHFAIAAQAALAVQGDAGDQQQRLRVALESLRHDLNMAGAGPSRGAARGPLISAFAPVLPARLGVSGADPELAVHMDRISIMYVPDTPAQSALRSAMAAVSSPLAVAAGGCAAGTACGFAPGDRALIFECLGEGSAHEVFTVAAVDAGSGVIIPQAPLAHVYPAGSGLASITLRNYYIDRTGKRLMLYDGDGSDVPLVDHVVDLRFEFLAPLGFGAPRPLAEAQLADGPFHGESPNRFDADLLRVRRVRVTIRLERGSADRSVRDVEATIDVAPPNMALR